MASPRLTLVAVVLLLAAFTLTEAIRGVGPKKCCTRFSRKQVSFNKVQSYTRTSQQCIRPAIILTTTDGKVCVKPSEAWVKKIVQRLDAARVGGNHNL